MKIQIQNAKNLYLYLQLKIQPVLSEVALRQLQAEQHHPQRFPKAGPVHAALDRLIPWLEQLPVFPVRMVGLTTEESQDPACVFSHHTTNTSSPNTGVGELPVRGWVKPRLPRGASSSHTFEVLSHDPADLGWPVAEQLARHEQDLKMVLLAFGFSYEDYEHRVAAAKGLGKKAQGWTLQEPQDETLFARCDTFALFSLESQGFLNDKGRYVPLGGARTFETALQASRTATARRLTGVVVMRLKTQVVAIDPVIELGGDLGRMGPALAMLEAEELRETLRRAKEEDLLAQLETLRATGQVPGEAAEPVRVRRRM